MVRDVFLYSFSFNVLPALENALSTSRRGTEILARLLLLLLSDDLLGANNVLQEHAVCAVVKCISLHVAHHPWNTSATYSFCSRTSRSVLAARRRWPESSDCVCKFVQAHENHSSLLSHPWKLCNQHVILGKVPGPPASELPPTRALPRTSCPPLSCFSNVCVSRIPSLKSWNFVSNVFQDSFDLTVVAKQL